MDNYILQRYLFINFFFLALTILIVFYYAFRLKALLRRSETLRKMTEKYRNLVNTTSEGVFQCDMEGQFLMMNKGGAQILGYDGPLSLFSSNHKLSHFFRDAEILEKINHIILQKEEVVDYTVEIQRPDGKNVFLDISAHGIFEEGQDQPSAYEGIFRDVTQRMEMRRELQSYSENLEALVKEKTDALMVLERKRIQLESLAELGETTASFVHELRNPLSSIKMGLNTLIRRLDLEPHNRQCVDVASNEVAHMETILKEILQFSRPETSKLIKQPLNPIVEMSVNQVRTQIEGDGIDLYCDYAENLPQVMVDFGKINQVIFNLLANSQKALESGGEIHVKTDWNKTTRIVRIEVKDTGVGIEEADLKEIYRPFFSKSKGGTGLGLSIARKIIHVHGGTIHVASQVGEGTTVTIELPAV